MTKLVPYQFTATGGTSSGGDIPLAPAAIIDTFFGFPVLLSLILDFFIPDPGSINYKKGRRKNFLSYLLIDIIFTKCILFYFKTGIAKNLSQLTKNFYVILTQKCILSSQKYVFGIRDLDPGGQKSTVSRRVGSTTPPYPLY
jgi:hypothetical protein